MDVWDVSRRLIRRWPVSVPLLVLTAAATMLISFNVRPDYVGTAYVSLLPPTAQRSAAQGQTLRVNPWDTERLTNAVTVRLNTMSFANQIKAESYRGTWKAGLDEQYGSVVRIEVTSPTPGQARSLTARLLGEIDNEVARHQARYPNLGTDDKITTARLDSGDNVNVSTARAKRATVVVAVVGLVLTAAVSASVDALVGRRKRRRRPAGTGATGSGSTGVDADATQVIRITNVALRRPAGGPATVDPAGRTGSPDDSTIVLPLSNAPWAKWPGSRPDGGGKADKAENPETAETVRVDWVGATETANPAELGKVEIPVINGTGRMERAETAEVG